MTAARTRLPRSVWLAAGLGVVLRLAFGLAYWVNEPLTRDEIEYLTLARNLADGRGLTLAAEDGAHDAFGRAPGYPAFLALLGAAPDPAGVPTRVKIAQALVGGIGVVLVALLAARLAGTRAALVAAWLAAAYPPLVWIAARAFSEALFWPVSVAAILLFDRATDRTPRGHSALVGAGVVAGLALLIRPGFVFFVPLAALWLAVRHHPVAAVTFCAGAVLCVAPWTARNAYHHGRFVLVAPTGGVNFWIGNHPLATGDGDMAANVDLKRAHQALRAEHPQLSEEQMEPVYYREALAWIRAEPAAWARLQFRKVFYFVVPIGSSYRLHSTRYIVASLVSFGLLAVVSLAGLWRLGRDSAASPGLWLALGTALVASLVFFPQERYRISTLDPLLLAAAGACARKTLL